MDVALKIWRFDPETGERALREYEVDAPDWACLLDVLDLIKDKHDGTLAYRKSCRMMICGSCGMRMDRWRCCCLPGAAMSSHAASCCAPLSRVCPKGGGAARA